MTEHQGASGAPRSAIGRLIEAIDADVPIDDVIEDDTEFQVFLSGHLVKALRACADALAPPSTESDDLAHDAKVQAVHLRLTQRANELHSAHVALEEAAEEIVNLHDKVADALAPPEPPQRDFSKWARLIVEQVEDISENGQSEGLSAADVIALTLAQMFPAPIYGLPAPPRADALEAPRTDTPERP